MRKILTELSSQAYEHPFDRKALAAVKKMPGVSLLIKKINDYGIDSLLRLQCIGSEIKVTPRNFPQLHQTFIEACQIIDIAPVPELHLCRGTGHIETHIVGVEEPIVSINLEAMEWLGKDELIFALGHEAAHVKSQHMIYHQMAIVMPVLKDLMSSSTLGLGGLVASGMELALYNWRMMAELTVDRAGLLACQDINVAISTLLKTAGLPDEYVNDAVIEDFIAQAREFPSDGLDGMERAAQVLSYTNNQLSWAVMRTHELLKWVDSGEYENVIQQKNVEIPETKEGWNFLTSW
ncbi:MAG: M48 family metallopeptidase [Nostoc sp. LLA-1]|nr:M48 family metallopeptidase [Cyanocohniella sp. LLY]